MAQVDEEPETKTFLDSGTTHYCFCNRSDFETYIDLIAKQGDSATEGGKFSINGQGRVTQQVEVEGKEINLQFNNALHTPDDEERASARGKTDISRKLANPHRALWTTRQSNTHTTALIFRVFVRSEGELYEVSICCTDFLENVTNMFPIDQKCI